MPASVAELLALPVTYDIIVSDFGREAAIEYLRIASAEERRLILDVLAEDERPFFDEYRRTMFTVLGDLAFFKEEAISAAAKGAGYLTYDVLIGLGPSPMSQGFADRVALGVVQEMDAAVYRGHDRIRVAIPCNGLSALAQRVGEVLASRDQLLRLVQASNGSISSERVDLLASRHVVVHTVPEAVVRHIADLRSDTGRIAHLLILGTSGTQQIYRQLAEVVGLDVLPLTALEQELIDRTIVAAIVGEPNELASCRRDLESIVVEPRRALDSVVTVGACTDFRLDLGISSLQVFAREMVRSAYTPREGRLS